MAAKKAASFALEGLLNPVIFLTNCNEAARTSSSVTGGLKLKRVLMFLHIAVDLIGRALDVGDAIDLNQGVSRNATGSSNGGAHRRFISETALEFFIHRGVILQIVQIDVDLQNF